VTSSLFIDRLSEVYAEYKDLIQPVQVAIYEMKLGVSLAVSAAVERKYLKKVDGENSQRILASDDCSCFNEIFFLDDIIVPNVSFVINNLFLTHETCRQNI